MRCETLLRITQGCDAALAVVTTGELAKAIDFHAQELDLDALRIRPADPIE